MAKVKPFLIVFLSAYLLSRILMSVLGITSFSLDDPSWLSLILDITVWFLSWSVSYIVYYTVRDAFKPNKQTQTDETPGLS